MIPPHTVFLLQFAKYRPECVRNAAAQSSVPTEPAPRANPAARRASPLRRLFNLIEIMPTHGA